MAQPAAFGSAVRLTRSTLAFIGDPAIAPATLTSENTGPTAGRRLVLWTKWRKQASALNLALPLENRGGYSREHGGPFFPSLSLRDLMSTRSCHTPGSHHSQCGPRFPHQQDGACSEALREESFLIESHTHLLSDVCSAGAVLMGRCGNHGWPVLSSTVPGEPLEIELCTDKEVQPC